MSKAKKSISTLAKSALSAVSDPKYNSLHLFLDGLKSPAEEINKNIIMCNKTPKKPEGMHA